MSEARGARVEKGQSREDQKRRGFKGEESQRRGSRMLCMGQNQWDQRRGDSDFRCLMCGSHGNC